MKVTRRVVSIGAFTSALGATLGSGRAAGPWKAEAVAGGKRVSIVKGDPGERLYAECCGDGKTIKVFLDGLEQREAVTADEELGFVTRSVVTERGNLAINYATNEVLEETVYGKVVIEII